MENNYSQMDLGSYVAKYIDENGCSLDEACDQLEIDKSQIFSQEDSDETFQCTINNKKLSI